MIKCITLCYVERITVMFITEIIIFIVKKIWSFNTKTKKLYNDGLTHLINLLSDAVQVKVFF